MKRKQLNFEIPEDIMESYAAETARQIQEQIDFDVMADIMESLGWVKLTFASMRDSYEAREISDWLKANCTGHYKNLGDTWLFESAKDASWFMLRWS